MIFSWAAIRSFLIVALLSALLTTWLAFNLDFATFLLWLFSLNIVTFVWFAKDKFCSAREGWPRTPEGAFMWMGLAGAFPALLIGMFTFHHKQAKPAFWVPMAFYMLLQMALLYYFFADISAWVLPYEPVAAITPPAVDTSVQTPIAAQ
jgi:uncharacterized membrane protein YsdA (DUF1294 family)